MLFHREGIRTNDPSSSFAVENYAQMYVHTWIPKYRILTILIKTQKLFGRRWESANYSLHIFQKIQLHVITLNVNVWLALVNLCLEGKKQHQSLSDTIWEKIQSIVLILSILDPFYSQVLFRFYIKVVFINRKLPPYTLTGFDLTTHNFSHLGGRRRRDH
jgi:hypothetical protein